jgi:SAM-dependent methyltransferase
VPVFATEDYLTGERFAIVRCRRCGLHRTELEPDRDLSDYYGPAYYGRAGRRFAGFIERLVAVFRRIRARRVARLTPGPARILDLGCGRGMMLAALQARGWECTGTEASPELAEAALRHYGLRVLPAEDAPLPFPDASMDVATSWHTLEHMERPVRMIGDIYRILKPGAVLVVEVPNLASIQARLGGSRWFHLDVPRHRYHLSRAELREILIRSGFRILADGTFSLEYGPFGMVQSILNRVTFRPNVLFQLLKRCTRNRTGLSRLPWAWDLLSTALLAVPAAAAGTALELLAVLAGRGGVARFVARK